MSQLKLSKSTINNNYIIMVCSKNISFDIVPSSFIYI